MGAYVELYRCNGSSCWDFVGWTYAGFSGEILFENGAYNLDSPLLAGNYLISIHAFNYEVGQVGPFSVSGGQELDLGDIGLTPLPRAGSIHGRLVDAVSGEPLSGSAEPFAFVELLHCDPEPYCYTIRWANAGPRR